MSSLQQSHEYVDLESENIKDGGGCEANKIVEDNGCNDKDKEERRESNVSECSVEIVDLESLSPETKVCLDEAVRDCRICHLSMDADNQESGIPIELGCSCKDDLAAAHKQCAEAWFKIRGNKNCEICGSIAQNVSGVFEANPSIRWDDQSNDGGGATAAASIASTPLTESSRGFWQGQRFLNFLLACMVFAFVVSWLFHFNMPSW